MYIDLNTIHNPSPGGKPSAAYGDQIRENFEAIFTALLSAITGGRVDASETTTSTAYTDLSTPGPSRTVDLPSTRALVIFGAQMFQTTGGTGRMSFELSGANSLAAADTNAIAESITTTGIAGCRAMILTGLTPGATTFTCKYKTSANTLNASARFIIVVPLP